jgi:hypothetical protein
MDLVPDGDHIFNGRITCIVLLHGITIRHFRRLTCRYRPMGCSCCHLVGGTVIYIDMYRLQTWLQIDMLERSKARVV